MRRVPLSWPRTPCAATIALLGAAPAALRAQVSEIVRGRVVDDSARAVAGALVHVTRAPDRRVVTARTDSAGRFVVRVPGGTGDYLVSVSAPGFRTVRRRVGPAVEGGASGAPPSVPSDFVLRCDLARLAAVRVEATRPQRATIAINPTRPEVGASERWSEDGVAGQLGPAAQGDLLAAAGTVPGVTLSPTGPAILGSGGDANLVTLNGLALPGGALPRLGRGLSRVTGATWDPTRGGFSGANVDVQLARGQAAAPTRTVVAALDAPALQATDAIGRAAGARLGGARLSGGASGGFTLGRQSRDAFAYNVALDLERGVRDVPALGSASGVALTGAGIAPGAAADVLTAARGFGLPGVFAGAERVRDGVRWIGRFDDVRDSLTVRTLTTIGGSSTEQGLGLGPLAAASTAGARRDRALGVQLVSRDFVGAGRRRLSETRLGVSGTWRDVRPLVALPTATVLVPAARPLDMAAGPAGSPMTEPTAALTLGGGGLLALDERRWTAEGANETVWNARGTRHRFKTLVWGRADGLRDASVPNALGTYVFPSPAAFAAGEAASFTRVLTQPPRNGAVWNAAAALAHQWTPTRTLNVLYGVRLEANGAFEAPAANPALAQALPGLRTGTAPRLVHASPRAGFTWTYSRAAENRNLPVSNAFGGFYRAATGVVRGGIGEFRSLLRPGTLAEARAATGLADGTLLLTCVGDAVPAVRWADFATTPSTIPERCLDGSGTTITGATALLGERAAPVTLYARGFEVPRSWRASLDWDTGLGPWQLRVATLASYDLALPSVVDANFSGIVRQTLGGEAGRRVWVPAGAVDATTGAVSPAAARRSDAYGRVGVLTSDLRGYGGQMTVSVGPDLSRDLLQDARRFYGNVAYTLQETRRQYRGFDGAGFGDPRRREWGPSPFDARHAVLVQAGYAGPRVGTLTLFARLQSGLPFTPIVQGDVDGDGVAGDRAFVPDYRPGGAGDAADPPLAAALRALATTGTAEARACLARSIGAVAARGECRGPWTQTVNLLWRPPAPKGRFRRLRLAVYAENLAGGLDQLLHGDDLRGWGQPTFPDPVLLVPRGFTPGTPVSGTPNGGPGATYRYAVNPTFGDARPAAALARVPFRVTLDVRLALAPEPRVRTLERAYRPPPSAPPSTRVSADALTRAYLRNTSNLYLEVLTESDSLLLTAAQVAALRAADSAFSAQVLAVYRPLGAFLATLPPKGRTLRDVRAVALDSVAATERRYWPLFWQQPEAVARILTPTQVRLLPWLGALLAVPPGRRPTTEWYSGYAVQLPGSR